MSRLDTEHQRLFRLPAEAATHAGSDDVRVAALGLSAPADWSLLSAVWRGVQTDLGLPAPAIAVSGHDGYQLWFSLAQALPSAQAQDFIDALQARYLPEVAPRRIASWPGTEPHALPLPPLPPLQTRSTAGDERWSAFVAPDLAPVFADSPWLDTPPNPDGQADVLNRLRSITPDEWLAARITLGLDAQPPQTTATPAPAGNKAPPASPAPLYAPAGDTNPRSFLQSVMNDPSVALALRIEAAKALL